jgi:hypothetical protein
VKRAIALSILALGCSSGGNEGGDPSPPSCTNTEVLVDGACVASGVDVCAEGFESDGAGGCKAILPDAECKGTTIATPGDRACRPVGVTACAEGFQADDTFQCAAVVGEECGFGTLTVLGSMDCQPLGDCGTTTWGPMPIEPGTIFVDGTYAKGDSDGSIDRPFAELAPAIALADATRKTILLAEGIYEHGEVIDKSLEIRGRCSEKVVIAPPKGSSSPSITVRADLTLRSLTIGSSARGLQIESGTTKLSHVLVNKTGAEGVVVANGSAAVELEDSIVHSATDVGVLVVGGHATLTRSNVRRTFAASEEGGAGLRVQSKGTAVVNASVLEANGRFGVLLDGSTLVVDRSAFLGNQVPTDAVGASVFAIGDSHTTIDGSTFESNDSIAVYAADGVLTLKNTVIANTHATAGVEPAGLYAAVDPRTKKPATALVSNSAFVANEGSGLFVAGAVVTVDGSLVRETRETKDVQSGEGIVALTSDVLKKRPTLVVRDSLIESAHHAGVTAISGETTVERSVVRDILASADGRYGFGVVAYPDGAEAHPTVVLRHALVERVHDAGVWSLGSEVVVDASLIRDLVQRKGGSYGHGIYASRDPELMQIGTLTVSGSVVDGAFEVGINVFQSNATVERTTVTNTRAGAGFGDGVSIAGSQLNGDWLDVSLLLRHSRVAGSARAALSIFEARASLEGVILGCSAFPLDVESGDHPVDVHDLGANGCGCEGALDRCTASSANLRAVAAF